MRLHVLREMNMSLENGKRLARRRRQRRDERMDGLLAVSFPSKYPGSTIYKKKTFTLTDSFFLSFVAKQHIIARVYLGAKSGTKDFGLWRDS